MSIFKDHFSQAADRYAVYRPRYPPGLFSFLASACRQDRLAWDCATGNGQAALGLADHFDRVVATDASERQIENALPHDRVTYRVAAAEQSGIGAASVDLVTVAQALHWLDLPAFYGEVRRAAASSGVVSVWCYDRLTIDAATDRVIGRYYEQIVGPYWPPERALVEEGYASLPFPFDEIETPSFSMTEQWDLETLLGYLSTWSATTRYRQAVGIDPRDLIRAELTAAWGDPAMSKTVQWPLAVRAGRL